MLCYLQVYFMAFNIFRFLLAIEPYAIHINMYRWRFYQLDLLLLILIKPNNKYS